MTPARKASLKRVARRFARAAVATMLAGAVGFVAGPDFTMIVPAPYNGLLSAVLIPLLMAADKAVREQG